MTSKAIALPGFLSGIPLTRTEKRLPRSRHLSPADFKTNLAIGLLVITGAVLLLYIFGINQSAAKGYEITKAKAKLSIIQEDNQKLQIRLAEAGSISQIQSQADTNHLVQITNQEYLQTTQLSQR